MQLIGIKIESFSNTVIETKGTLNRETKNCFKFRFFCPLFQKKTTIAPTFNLHSVMWKGKAYKG